MSYPDATETFEHILKPALLRLKNQDILNIQTQHRFEALSASEKKNLSRWAKSHLADIPMPPRTKQTALDKLLMGDYHHLSTLTLIRYTLKALKL